MAGKMRVHELARELGIDSAALLKWLNVHGESTKSASSTIEPAVERKVREVHPRAAPLPPGQRRTRLTPSFGTSLSTRTQPRPRDARIPWSPARDLAEEWAGIRRDDPAVVRHYYILIQEWLGLFIEIDHIRMWHAAGLQPQDSQLVAPILAAGLRLDDLGRVVGGITVLKRIRGGESPAAVRARLLEQAG